MNQRVKQKLEQWGIHFHTWQYTDKPPMAITPSSERWYWYVCDCTGCDKELYVMGIPTKEMIEDLKERKWNDHNPRTPN